MRTEIPLVVVNPSGVPVPAASAQINFRGTATPATIYQAETGPSTFLNPLTTDLYGRVSGWLERAAYDVVVSGPGLTTYTEYLESVPAQDRAIDTLWLADSAVTGAKIAALAIGTGHIQDGSVTAAKLAVGAIPAGTTFGLLSARPSAAGVGNSWFYATDQVALYLSNGTTWIRVGSQPGDILYTVEVSARTGYLLLNGAAWPSTTGIYADLFAKLGGASLPDHRGRMPVGLGTHADVSSLLANEGTATVGNRRPRHRTTHALTLPPHVHGPAAGQFVTMDSAGGDNITNSVTAGGTDDRHFNTGNPTTTPAITGSLGTNVGTDPLDTSPYLVLNPQVKL